MKRLLVALLCITCVSAFAESSQCEQSKANLKANFKQLQAEYTANDDVKTKEQKIGHLDLQNYNIIMQNKSCFPKLVKRMQNMQEKLND